MSGSSNPLVDEARRMRFDDLRFRASLVMGLGDDQRKALTGYLDFAQHAAVDAGNVLASPETLRAFNVAQRSQGKVMLEKATLETARRYVSGT